MLNKEALLLLTDNPAEEEWEPEDIGASGNRVLRFDTMSDCELTSLVILGSSEYADGANHRGLGYLREDGGFSLDVRVHGVNFFDGHELARLMRAEGSPAYGGDYDGEHFLYVGDASDTYTVVGSDHMAIPSQPCTVRIPITLSEDVSTSVIPGLRYETTSGSRSALYGPATTECETVLSGKTIANQIFSRFVHVGTGKDMQVQIYYDHVSLSEGNEATEEPYSGEAVTFDLGDVPLFGDEYEVYDELDCMNGIITRRYGGGRINAKTDITEAVYMGIPCFRIRLPEFAKEGRITVGEYIDCGFDHFAELGESVILSPEGNALYFRLYDGSTLDEVEELLDGELMFYPLLSEKTVELGHGVDPYLTGMVHYVEACSTLSSPITITYREME